MWQVLSVTFEIVTLRYRYKHSKPNSQKIQCQNSALGRTVWLFACVFSVLSWRLYWCEILFRVKKTEESQKREVTQRDHLDPRWKEKYKEILGTHWKIWIWTWYQTMLLNQHLLWWLHRKMSCSLEIHGIFRNSMYFRKKWGWAQK
jgi:hypothetical protein